MQTAILNITQGDWNYIDEWITYHHNIGIDFIYIAYNGKSEEFNRLPKYEYVRYFDVSTSELDIYEFMKHEGKDFGARFDPSTGQKPFMQLVENLMLKQMIELYPSIDYTFVIDTDEFIKIKDDKYSNNIKNYIEENFDTNALAYYIVMKFYNDNNLIYYDDKPVLERFTTPIEKPKDYEKYSDYGHRKTIINMKHPDINDTILISPHSCNHSNDDYIFDLHNIELAHYFTKTIEEWISKFNYDIDKDYFRRFDGQLFTSFFKHRDNAMTKDKIKAIPKLLKKYGLYEVYDVEKEWDEDFKKIYKEINGF